MTLNNSNLPLASHQKMRALFSEQDPFSFHQSQYEECLFILKNYSTPEHLIKYMLNTPHQEGKGLHDACEYVLNEHLPAETFINEILVFCIQSKQIKRLLHTMDSMDPQHSERAKRYIQHACAFLQQNKLEGVLFTFNMYLKNYVEAGNYCIKSQYALSNLDDKMRYLNIA